MGPEDMAMEGRMGWNSSWEWPRTRCMGIDSRSKFMGGRLGSVGRDSRRSLTSMAGDLMEGMPDEDM